MSTCVFLLSSVGGNLVQMKRTQKIDQWLASIPNLNVDKVDGAVAENKDTRTALWECSGQRGYPQLYIRDGEGNLTFIGDYEEIEYLVESEQFKGKFADCVSDDGGPQ
eukprot:TRINITY_DN907_c0_g1_i1.p1 TRINITY_DN907_c0_g1~~TRINITY_DN907_c0_g1_i1.p1  ORF type:complete len:108 (+),score=31.61 TRINITY_DN907_c0_g1_i1:31-354(+)